MSLLTHCLSNDDEQIPLRHCHQLCRTREHQMRSVAGPEDKEVEGVCKVAVGMDEVPLMLLLSSTNLLLNLLLNLLPKIQLPVPCLQLGLTHFHMMARMLQWAHLKMVTSLHLSLPPSRQFLHQTNQCRLTATVILITNGSISTIHPLRPLLLAVADKLSYPMAFKLHKHPCE